MARILIIDDDKGLCKTIRLTLARAGHDVVTAPNALEGLEKFADGTSWDLTLTDQRMPGMEGMDVIREIKGRNPTARVLMMTAFGSVQLATEALLSGATDFLRKPFSPELLRTSVEAVLNRLPEIESSVADPAKPNALVESVAPKIRNFINGYFYWPIPLPEGVAFAPVPAAEVRRAFHVEKPTGEGTSTVVGVMPHVREQVRAGAGYDSAPDDPLWNMVCQVAVINYLWEQAEMPPPFIPLYELTSDLMAEIRKRTGFMPTPVY